MKRPDPDGFVLVAVLWFAALAALVAVIVEGWISSSLDQAFALQQRVAARTALIDLESRVEFYAVSDYFSVRGLELPSDIAAAQAAAAPLGPAALLPPTQPFIALDGRPYRFGTIVVRLQDEAGLTNLNSGGGYVLRRMLKAYGLAYDERDALSRRLLDYVAPPDSRAADILSDRASAGDYARAGLPPPRHAPLLTPWEAFRILGWDRADALWRGEDALPEMIAVGRFTGVNANTAPPLVLATIPGLDDEAIGHLIAARERYPIANSQAMEEATGVIAAGDQQLTFFPSNSFRVEAMPAQDKLAHHLVIRLTPLGPAPYRIDYAVDLPRDSTTRRLVSSAGLPELPSPAGYAGSE